MKKIFIYLVLSILSSSVFSNTLIIVPFSSGGAIDKMAREFSIFVKLKTGENLIVENKTGAGSIVGTNALLSSNRPDNTLLITSGSFFNNIVEEKFKKEEFQLVAVLGVNPYVLVTTNSKNISCKDIRDKNKKFFIGTAGKGSASDIAANLLVSHYDNFVIVPYKGISQVLLDLVPGRLDFTFTSGLKDRDNVRLVATTTTNKVYKDVIDWKSCLGINLNYYNDYLIVARSSASEDFIKKINSLALEFSKDPEIVEKFNQDGVQMTSYSLRDTRDYYSSNLSNWRKLLNRD